MHPALTAPAAPALTGAVLCSISLAASRPQQNHTTVLRINNLPKVNLPKISLPKVSLPKLPDIDLPNFGKKGGTAPAKDAPAPRARAPARDVKVRASNAVPAANPDAPTADEIAGRTSIDTIAAGAGYKKYPARRMPGANMDGWKDMAKDMKLPSSM